MHRSDRIGRRVKLRNLDILQAAVKAGSMAKAATDLGISQPAVSYAVTEMERLLGVPLLDRTSQGVTPTAYGRALLERSVVVFNELRQAIGEIEHLADPAVGELHIGIPPALSAIVSAVINRLIAQYPRMVFRLVVGPASVLIPELRRGNIDLAIRRMIGRPEDDLKAQTLFQDELAVICGKSNTWARRRGVELRELMDEPWALWPPSSYLGHLTREVFAAHGLDVPRATVSAPSTHAISVLVANGPFLTILPGAMLGLSKKHPLLAAVAVDMRATRNPICLITLRNRALSPVARLFAEAASAVGKARER
jgi:DNA-binding transcriptional LysR family regulator